MLHRASAHVGRRSPASIQGALPNRVTWLQGANVFAVHHTYDVFTDVFCVITDPPRTLGIHARECVHRGQQSPREMQLGASLYGARMCSVLQRRKDRRQEYQLLAEHAGQRAMDRGSEARGLGQNARRSLRT